MGRLHPTRGGFTLIEISVVLVIIGLIVGGVLVGRSLITSAQVRATITQIETYNTAANTFREKYGYLPGDIKDPEASRFGFKPRGQYAGEGDGNGVIQGNYDNQAGMGGGTLEEGETTMFWVDLSTANLIDGTFTLADSTILNENASGTPSCGGNPGSSIGPPISDYLPQAKLGNGNFIYVWSGGPTAHAYTTPAIATGNSINYFGLSATLQMGCDGGDYDSAPALSVQQAYSIDQKIDDGFPQSGNVTALYVYEFSVYWAAGGGGEGAGIVGASGSGNSPTTMATPGSATTCYDNGNAAGATQQYSVEISNGANVNCALSFKMQAGD